MNRFFNQVRLENKHYQLAQKVLIVQHRLPGWEKIARNITESDNSRRKETPDVQ